MISKSYISQGGGIKEHLKFAAKQIKGYTSTQIHFLIKYGDLPLPPEPDNALHHGECDLPPPPESERILTPKNRMQNKKAHC